MLTDHTSHLRCSKIQGRHMELRSCSRFWWHENVDAFGITSLHINFYPFFTNFLFFLCIRENIIKVSQTYYFNCSSWYWIKNSLLIIWINFRSQSCKIYVNDTRTIIFLYELSFPFSNVYIYWIRRHVQVRDYTLVKWLLSLGSANKLHLCTNHQLPALAA